MMLDDALDQLARETTRARSRIGLERAARLALAPLAAAILWASAALLDLPARLPPLAASLLAWVALFTLLGLAVRAARNWRPATVEEARARLARDSGLDAAAFDSLEDRPSNYDETGVALWRRERERAVARAASARAGPFRPALDRMDRFRLRYLLAAGFVAALLFANVDAPSRLLHAFAPDPGPLFGDKPLAVEAWAAPLDYLHAGPVSLSDRIGERVALPPATDVTVRVSGPAGAPRLVFDAPGGGAVRFVRAADGAWEARMRIARAGTLRIVRFRTQASWRLAPAPDTAPRASFSAPIAMLVNERAAFGWTAVDDYGLRGLKLRVRPLHAPPGLMRADPVDTPLEFPAGDPRQASGDAEIDLAAHPYAGMEVEARVVAVDAVGQEGESDALRLTLPEKLFLAPLARAAIEIRRHVLAERRPYRAAPRLAPGTLRDLGDAPSRLVVEDPARFPPLARAPEGIKRATRLIDALVMAPEDGYFHDLAIYLGFRLARAELAAAQAIDETDLAAATLWSTALRAEYAGAADARRALEVAQQAMTDALRQGASPARLRELASALRSAAERYLQALVQDAAQRPPRNADDTAERTEITARDIVNMLARIEDAARDGRTGDAERNLQALAETLANLDVETQPEGQSQSDAQNQSADGAPDLSRGMDRLSQAIGEQRALNADTQQQSGGAGGGQQRGEGGGRLAERQAQIRQGLADARSDAEGAGEATARALDRARASMGAAEAALRRGDLGAAAGAQSAALERLREGAEGLAAALRARDAGEQPGQQGASGRSDANADGPPSGPRDPLGRSLTGSDGADAPTNLDGPAGGDDDPQNTRRIFDEISRRAQDPNRPEAEREYLRRLLDRFNGS